MNNEVRNRNQRHNRPRPHAQRPNLAANQFRQRQVTGQRHQNGNRPQSGNAQRNYERYMALAREAALSGDSVEMENCYQHAEHYFRVMRERTQ